MRVHRAVQPGRDQGALSSGVQGYPTQSSGEADKPEFKPNALSV